MSSVVTGVDPATGDLAADLAGQCRWMFIHLAEIVQAAGGSIADIVKVNVGMADSTQRETLNEAWLALFPDPDARPARQTQEIALRPGLWIQCDFMAVLDERPPESGAPQPQEKK